MPSPNQLIEEDRRFATRRGDELNQDAKDRAANEANVRQYYRSYGDEAYDPLIGGRGGYTPEDREAILREEELKGAMTSPEEFDANFMTGEEQNRAGGNPWARAAYFDPEEMDARNTRSGERQRGAVDQIDQAITPDLGLSDEFGQGIDTTLADTEGRVRGAVDPTRLRTDEAALNAIRMTPQEQQDIVTSAGISSGQGFRSAIGDLERSGRAAGVNPAGIGALRLRYERDAAGARGDSETQARVLASSEAARRAENAERLRASGETAYTDRATGTDLALGDRRLDTTTNKENMRLGTTRDVSNRRMGAGETRLGAEQGINAQERQQGQFNAGMGTDIATGIERDEVDRARYVSANRQNVARANQGQKFDQGVTTNTALSQRNTGVADATRADAREGRGYLQDQQQQANVNQQADYSRQQQNYGTQGGMTQQATNAAVKQDAKPKWWEKAISAGIGAAGSVLTGGASGGLSSLTSMIPKPKQPAYNMSWTGGG